MPRFARLTPEEVAKYGLDDSREIQEERNHSALAEERAKKQAQGTTRGSKENVPRKTKDQKRETAAGGASTKTSKISTSSHSPSGDSTVDTSAPDYYRNGYLQTTTKIVDGSEVTVQKWLPLPRVVESRGEEFLSSIRLIDTRRLSAEDPNQPEPTPIIPEYTKFFLTSVQEMNQEKLQIAETFNDWYVFFYGERPPTYTFSGYLLNMHNYNWWNEFAYYYQNFWRGTKSVEQQAKVFLTYNYQQVQGYVLNMSANLNAESDQGIPFSITVLVTKRLIFNGSKENDGIIRDSLLPRSDSGAINTSSNSKNAVKDLTRDFLQKDIPAQNNEVIETTKTSEYKDVVKNNLPSTKVQDYPIVGGGGYSQGTSLGTNWSSTAFA